jgi:hypothetical protein
MIADATAALIAAGLPLQRLERAEPLTLWITASEDGASATCVGVLQLVKIFAMGRTEENVNPPEPIPQITGADT